MSGKMILDDDLLDKVGGGIKGLPEEAQQNGFNSVTVQAINNNDGGSTTLTFTATPSDGQPQKLTVYHNPDGSWHAEQDGQGPTITVRSLDQ